MRHPELAAAKANRDYVLRQVCCAVDTIASVAKGQPLPDGEPPTSPRPCGPRCVRAHAVLLFQGAAARQTALGSWPRPSTTST